MVGRSTRVKSRWARFLFTLATPLMYALQQATNANLWHDIGRSRRTFYPDVEGRKRIKRQRRGVNYTNLRAIDIWVSRLIYSCTNAIQYNTNFDHIIFISIRIFKECYEQIASINPCNASSKCFPEILFQQVQLDTSTRIILMSYNSP